MILGHAVTKVMEACKPHRVYVGYEFHGAAGGYRNWGTWTIRCMARNLDVSGPELEALTVQILNTLNARVPADVECY